MKLDVNFKKRFVTIESSTMIQVRSHSVVVVVVVFVVEQVLLVAGTKMANKVREVFPRSRPLERPVGQSLSWRAWRSSSVALATS